MHNDAAAPVEREGEKKERLRPAAEQEGFSKRGRGRILFYGFCRLPARRRKERKKKGINKREEGNRKKKKDKEGEEEDTGKRSGSLFSPLLLLLLLLLSRDGYQGMGKKASIEPPTSYGLVEVLTHVYIHQLGCIRAGRDQHFQTSRQLMEFTPYDDLASNGH